MNAPESSNSPLTTAVFTILAGEAEVAFTAHGGVLAKSEVLKKEVEGGWKEGQEKTIRWKDWTVGGVERFLEWLYTGDYQCAYPIDTSEAEEEQTRSLTKKPEEKSDHEIIPARNLYLPGQCKLSKKTKAGEFAEWSEEYWPLSDADYSETFMTHAEMYVMASRYMLDELKSMAWQRLDQACNTIILDSSQEIPIYGNMVALIEYVYKETGASTDNEREPLRRLMKNAGLDRLLTPSEEWAKEFVVDLTDATIEHITDIKAQFHGLGVEKHKLAKSLATAQASLASVKKSRRPN
ncbi:MAG: hypothetical protein Q9174_002413 [Haloplaca sp. 1 TL-2023]